MFPDYLSVMNMLLRITFSRYLFVLGNFHSFLYHFFFFSEQWCLSQIETDNNDNDKCNNNRHISIEIINSEKPEATLNEYIL